MTNFDGINQDSDKLNIFTPPPRKHRVRNFIIFILLLLLAFGAWAATHYTSQLNQIFTNKKSIFTRVGSLFISQDKPLVGEDSGTINMLLLGIGGEGHDGANLTDTMIVASIRTDTKEVVLTSIPRDWVYEIPNHGLNKINAVYAYAIQDHPNDPNAGGQAAIAAAEKVTGFTIPYYATIDFKGFVKAVDHVGGLDITVDRTFSDSTFPNDFPFDTKGYLGTVTFNKGPQHMDGRTALIFARSRHGTNNEGSDFARSERQKKVLLAFKDKLSGLGLNNLSTLNNLLSDFTSNFRTNLEPYELMRLANMGQTINSDNVYSLSLEPQGDLICDTTIDQLTGRPYIHPIETTPATTTTTSTSTSGSSTSKTSKSITQTTPTPTPTVTPTPTAPSTPTQIPMYIVEPCEGKTLADVHNFLIDYWDTARLKKENAKIEVQNSTGKAAATTNWRNLAAGDFDISFVAFPGKTPFDRSIIYDNTKGGKPRTLQYLKDHFNLTQADVQFTNSKADFVIVVGNDALQ